MTASQHHTKLCFIGGSGRSGTTILREVLSKHPDAAGMHEFRITVDPDGLVDFYTSLARNWSPYLFDVKFKRLEKLLRSASKTPFAEKVYRFGLKKTGFNKLPFRMERRNSGVFISDFCPDYDDLVQGLLGALKDFSYRGFSMGNEFGTSGIHFAPAPDLEKWNVLFGDFYRAMATSVMVQQKANAFVDDNTWNILHFNTLQKWLPEAKLVHIYRHPLDVISSYTTQAWAPNDPVEGAQFYLSLLNRWLEVREQLSPDNYLEISLEALSAQPEPTLRKVTDLFGLNWNEQLLSVDLSRSNSGRWKRDLPKDQIPQMIDILQPILNEYGYQADE